MAEEEWIWVSLPWATFGLVVRAGKIVDAAPIAAWCVGGEERSIAAYWRKRGAVFQRLPSRHGPRAAAPTPPGRL